VDQGIRSTQRLQKLAGQTAIATTATLQAGDVHELDGRRHELLHWMDLMDLVANALNLKLLGSVCRLGESRCTDRGVRETCNAKVIKLFYLRITFEKIALNFF
jgi:hypothetical protein